MNTRNRETSAAIPGVDGERVAATALVERADELRARDKALWRVTRRVLRWLLLLAVPSSCAFAIAAPNVLRFPCRSMQSESKGNLKALYVAEESARADNDRYTTDRDTLGFVPKGAHVRYRYVAHVDDDGKRFIAYAIGEEPPLLGDLWSITSDNELHHERDGCAR